MLEGPTKFEQPKTEEYLKNNPVYIPGIGYNNTSYFRVKRQEIKDKERQ